MNIFVLSEDVVQCAQWHVSKHSVKMPLEISQLLCTAHRVIDGTLQNKKWVLLDDRNDILYSATHVNHPCAKWVRESLPNYYWTYNMFLALLDEYSYRYNKVHGCSKLVDVLKNAPYNLTNTKMTEFVQAMPDDVKVPNDAVQAYQNYYRTYKTHLAEWKNRETPEWFHA